MNTIITILIGLLLPFAATTLGSAMVFIFRDEVKANVQRAFLGFAAGIMLAASVWSLLIPSIDMAREQGVIGWVPSAGGFILGGIFLLCLDSLIPHLHINEKKPEGLKSSFKRTTKLIFAVTLHNIPEGMAVGMAFALAIKEGTNIGITSAMALSIGMALQNFPEGAAISLPLKQEGMSKGRSFIYGTLSGIVEPIGGLITILITGAITYLLPWFLSFAAGAMIYVVVEELIPEAQRGDHSNVGVIGVMVGFVIMMILDVGLS